MPWPFNRNCVRIAEIIYKLWIVVSCHVALCICVCFKISPGVHLLLCARGDKILRMKNTTTLFPRSMKDYRINYNVSDFNVRLLKHASDQMAIKKEVFKRSSCYT